MISNASITITRLGLFMDTSANFIFFFYLLLLKYLHFCFVGQVDLSADHDLITFFQSANNFHFVSEIGSGLYFGEISRIVFYNKHLVITHTSYESISRNSKGSVRTTSREKRSTVHSRFQFVKIILNRDFNRKLQSS